MQGSKHTSCDVHACLPRASDWELVDLNAAETGANDVLISFLSSSISNCSPPVPGPLFPLNLCFCCDSVAVFSGASSLPSDCSPLTLHCQSLLIM